MWWCITLHQVYQGLYQNIFSLIHTVLVTLMEFKLYWSNEFGLHISIEYFVHVDDLKGLKSLTVTCCINLVFWMML